MPVTFPDGAHPIVLKAAADALTVSGLNNDQVFEVARAMARGANFATATAAAAPRFARVAAGVATAWQTQITALSVSKRLPQLERD